MHDDGGTKMSVRCAIRWSLLPLAILTILLMADRLTQADDKPSDQKPSDTTALEGKPAPEFALQTVDGNQVELSKLKGSVVLLDFWATWCGPCKVELPHTQQFSADKDLAAKGLKVFAVNQREPRERSRTSSRPTTLRFRRCWTRKAAP